MTWSVTIILLLLALILTVGSALGRVPLWIPLFLVVVVQLLMFLPAK